MNGCGQTGTIRRWDMFELSLNGPDYGNPFMDVSLRAVYKIGNREVMADGFYDGDGIYKLRFMPDTLGKWNYVTISDCPKLDGLRGEINCIEPLKGNHGPIRVKNTFHFAYEDGAAYLPFGTTCYAWNHQGDKLKEETLKTLKTMPFNKMRMCVFPKHYDYNHNEPVFHAFEGNIELGWDFSRFNPDFFKHLEKRISDLLEMGIEADLIIFHPYDRWGYAAMDADTDDRYLRYLVARLAAFRNIWWSLANEYDLMETKTMSDWDRYFRIVQEYDHVGHLRSIHNCRGFYDHGKPWVTHSSIQHSEMQKVTEWRDLYKKPVVVDECCYEGNISHDWGNITAQEMVHRFWEGSLRGGYVGHEETYMHPQEILWWSKGGVLHGQSPERIGFLKRIMEEGPEVGFAPLDFRWDVACGGIVGEYYLMYFGIRQPSFRIFDLPLENKFKIEVIDTWNMTITSVEGEFSGKCKVDLTGKPYMALRIQKI